MEATLETLALKSRECFLDLGAFPEDKKIPLEIIINIWVELHDLEEETAFAVLVDLSDKNLLTLKQALDMAEVFPNLSDLTIDHCDDLVELPPTICGITSVSSISITNCPGFVELPKKNLSELKSLELLRLYACSELESLPEEIATESKVSRHL
ncbi:putative disease resistance protein [Raphanus sativus]|nr:putative disease resistance protein [Raphanus sativus]